MHSELWHDNSLLLDLPGTALSNPMYSMLLQVASNHIPANANTSGESSVPAAQGPSLAQRPPVSWHAPSSLVSSLRHTFSLPHIPTRVCPSRCRSHLPSACCVCCLGYGSQGPLPGAIHCGGPQRSSPLPALGFRRTGHTATDTAFLTKRVQFFVDVSSKSPQTPSFLCF